MHVHDLVPYLRSGNHHDFGHVINRFSFGADGDPLQPTKEMLAVKKRLEIVDPLQGVKGHTEESNYMFQCVVTCRAATGQVTTGWADAASTTGTSSRSSRPSLSAFRAPSHLHIK